MSHDIVIAANQMLVQWRHRGRYVFIMAFFYEFW